MILHAKELEFMKTAGIVVEYNPMHNGHIHHIKKTRELSGCDTLIAVMSGNVVQRGEFSIVDKFTKTKWALEAGIDLVVELPAFYSLQSADMFAYTSIQILEKLGVDTLVFGSESGSIDTLKMQSELMRTDVYNESLKTYMNEGYSYPSASRYALESLTDSMLIKAPNDILGIQYLNAIHKLKSPMEAIAIKRVESGYHEPYNEDLSIQSATALRSRLISGENVKSYVPSYVNETLKDYGSLQTLSNYDEILSYTLNVHSKETLESIFSFEEGLENLVLKHRDLEGFDKLVNALSSKRYTNARIKRALMHMMLDIKKSDPLTFEVPYLRILGMNATGKSHLNTIKKDLDVPLITKITRKKHPLLETELKVTRIYGLKIRKNLFEKEFDPVLIY